MKTNSHDETRDHNLVLFPASKNYKIDLSSMKIGPDPIHDLLNEYSHIKDDELPHESDDRFDLEQSNLKLEDEHNDNDEIFYSLEAFMSRNLREESQHPDDKLIKLINDRIQSIKETKERIKYYLEELEMFLPGRKK